MQEQQEHPVLYLPDGRVHKAASEDASQRSSFGPFVLFRDDLYGAQPKVADWALYLGMYKQHPYVKAAIDKLVKVCTNTGFDFVPRDSRSVVRDDEYRKAREFFDKQPDFLGELRRIYRDLLIFGDAYLYIVPDRKRRPARVKRLAPWSIHIKPKPNGDPEYFVQSDPFNPSGESVKFFEHEIIHFKIDNPGDDVYGLSPLEALKNTVATDLFAMTFNKNFFKNGASTGTIIVIEEATEEDIERNRRWIQESYVGTDNAHKPILIAGKVRVERGIATHSDMSFLEGRERIKQEILAVIDVPPAKIGDMETANRSNSKEQDKSFRSESVSPLQRIFESKFNDHFIRGILGLKDTVFKHSEADVRDALELADLNGRYLDRGVLTIDEVRATLGKGPVDGGNIPTIMTPTGAVPVDRLNLYFRLPQVNYPDVPPVPEDPPQGERVPPSREQAVTVERASLSAAVDYLQKATQPSLRQAYAFIHDVAESGSNWLIDNAMMAVKKALDTSDVHLKQAYAERALAYITQLLREGDV